MARILYLCPIFNHPSGGVKLLYRHVYQLNRMGFEAYILFPKQFSPTCKYEFEVPVACVNEEFSFGNTDLVVISEGMPNLIKTLSPQLNCVVIALNWHYIYLTLTSYEDWADWGIKRVFTTSPMIKKFVEWSMRIPTTMIQDFVDTQKYPYLPARKQNKISFMTRKSNAGQRICKIINKRTIPTKNSYSWIPLKDYNESTYAMHLIESKIYLACSSYEGVNMSVLEAMSAGCLVIGFAGVGGKDYMIGEGPNQNCILVENEDLLALGIATEEAMEAFNATLNAYQHIIDNGIATAARYNDFEGEAASLKAYFSELLAM